MSENSLPSIWRLAELKNVATFVSGGTPSRKKTDYFTGSIPWLTGYDLPEDQVTFVDESREYVTEEAIKESATNLVPPQAVLLTTRVTVGKVAIAQRPMCFSQDVTGIIIDDTEVIEPAYLAHFLLATREAFLFRNRGTTIQGITRGDLERFQIPLPPLSEQRRIVDILRQTDDLRRLRREADARMEDLQTALFFEVFGDITDISQYEHSQLGEIADIVSGVTKGRKLATSDTVEVPYLRVANVQAGYLDLSDIKTITATVSEVDRYALKNGDVLLTEGGDFDKLGRGAIWEHNIPNCIHQNHIFRVRVDQEIIFPQFFAALLNTSYAKSYFLRSAKRTTNLATINMRQLSSFPVPIPSLQHQQQFIQQLRSMDSSARLQEIVLHKLDQLSQSLLTRAFTGELTISWRKQHAEQMQEEATQRDITLGLRPRKSDTEFAVELDTQAGREAFDNRVQETVRPTIEQLVKAVTPRVRLGDIVKIEPLVDLNRLVSPMLTEYRNTINASLLRATMQLSKVTQESLAKSFRSIQAATQSVFDEHQRQIMKLAGQLAEMAALITRRPDEDHPRYHSLHALSDEQYRIYLAALQSDGYFTAESLLDEDDLPVETVRRTLVLLETLGLVAHVTVPATPTGATLFYVPVYRTSAPDDESRDDDLAALEITFPGLAV